jgi:hypothetical protein
VTDPGRLGQSSVDGGRVALRGPSWLVLGQSFDTGWRATCNGRDLGNPTPIDGYANGWRVSAACRTVSFAFAPQRGVVRSYVVSALVCALLLLFLLLGGRLGPRARVLVPAPEVLPDPPPARLPLPHAVVLAAIVTVPLCLIFALRSSVAILVVLALILWRGYGGRILALIAAGLLGVVVPLIYVFVTPKNEGGFDFSYSVDLIAAHWVGVAAVILLGVAAWRALSAMRRRPGRRPDPGGSGPAGAPAEPDAPGRVLQPAGSSTTTTARAE